MLLWLLGCDPTVHPLDDVLTVTDVQAAGTHNSYHVAGDHPATPDLAYTHAPLDEQLDVEGLRHFELDIDRADGFEFRVRHIAIIDEGSWCPLLTDCFATIAAWSAAHRAHGPIMVLMEVKERVAPNHMADWLAELDALVRADFADDQLLTPDLVQGDAADLATAAAIGWPTLAVARGRVMIVLYGDDDLRKAYTADDTTTAGRAMFAYDNGEPLPDVAFTVLDDPIAEAAPIADALARGQLVRARADSWPDPDPPGAEAALASGAQWISTDFPVPTAGTDYVFSLGTGLPYRCNPVTAPPECTAADIEDPKRLNR